MKAEYFKALCQMAVHGAQNLPDETAGTVPELYPEYEWLVENKNNTKFDGKNIPGEDGGKYFLEIP